MFESIEAIKEFLTLGCEELNIEEAWEIVRHQQDLDLFMMAYHYF